MIKAVGVVIPAHNEEDLLPSCLVAVRQAALTLTGTPVHVIVVADAVCRGAAEWTPGQCVEQNMRRLPLCGRQQLQ